MPKTSRIHDSLLDMMISETPHMIARLSIYGEIGFVLLLTLLAMEVILMRVKERLHSLRRWLYQA